MMKPLFIRRMWQTIQFDGPKIVFDMDYDRFMGSKLKRYTANQVKMFIADNRQNRSPFIINLCNVNTKTETMKQLETLIPTIRNSSFPINIHEECITDRFPREKLVYLTPDSQNLLQDYNHEDIFVLPGVIDKGQNGPITMAKAKKLGLRTAYLPLARYLNWGRGDKSLPLNLIANTLLDFKNKQDWNAALKHVPSRKLKPIRQERSGINEALHKGFTTDQMPVIKFANPSKGKKTSITENRNPFKIYTSSNRSGCSETEAMKPANVWPNASNDSTKKVDAITKDDKK